MAGEEIQMKMRRPVSVWYLLGACAVGFMVRTALDQPNPLVALAKAGPAAQAAGDGKLRIIVFGAHPDDAEYRGGGRRHEWAKLGHHVKLVSVTNGDIGHWQMAGGPLALAPQEGGRGGGAAIWASPPRCWTSTTASCCRRWRTGARSPG